MMSSLTTRQRDLLHILLNAETPLGAADLAAQMQLTPRQVSYGLNGLKQWLASRDITLNTTPGVGVILDYTPEHYDYLVGQLATESHFQLVLSAKLDFVHLSRITNRINQTVKKRPWYFHHIGFCGRH